MDTTSSCFDARMLHTEVLGSLDAFERLAKEWDELLEDSGQHVYFLRHHWNFLWWQQYAPQDSRLHIVCCREVHGRLTGIAPLYLRQHRFLRIPSTRELAFLGTGIELKTSEYLDVIARRGYEHQVAQSVAHILRRSRAWDRIWLHQVPAESRVLAPLIRALGLEAQPFVCDRSPFIDTSSAWETYKRSLGRSMRRNVEYYARRLFKTYSCEFGRVRTRAHLDAAMSALVRLHQARWQKSGKPGSFSCPGLEDLLTRAAYADLTAGRLRLWTLKIDNKIEGALIGFLDNGVLHYFQKGFNPEFAGEDLGTALLSLCIRDSFDDPDISAFDFMGGGATYKDLWAHQSRSLQTCSVQRPTMRTQLHLARERMREDAANIYRAIAPDSLRIARRNLLDKWRARRNLRAHRRGR